MLGPNLRGDELGAPKRCGASWRDLDGNENRFHFVVGP
jgi:hypothetical protein